MSVRIVDVREVTKPISSPIRNAYIDFTKMTTSLVAVVTDVVRDGKPVVGYGFNSNGRYGQGGLIRERFAPRLMEADPKTLLDETGDNLDPDKVWAALMSNEKPGGHGERSVAVGTIDMAVWDAVAKIAGKPLFRLLAERHRRDGRSARVRLCRRRLLLSRQGSVGAARRDARLSRPRLQRREDEDRRRADRWKTASASRRCCRRSAARRKLAVDANGRFDLETAIAYAKMLRDYPLFWYEEAGDPLDYQLQAALAEFYPGPMATGENLFSHQDARNLHPLRRHAARPRLAAVRLRAVLRAVRISAHARGAARPQGWSPSRCIPHGGHQMSLNIAAGLGLGGNESYPDLFQPYGGFPDGVRVENGHITMPDLPGIGFEGKSRSLHGDEGAGGVGTPTFHVIAGSVATKQSSLRSSRERLDCFGCSSAMTLRKLAVAPTTAAYPAAAGLRPSAVSSPRWRRRPRRHWRRPRGSSRCPRAGRDS